MGSILEKIEQALKDMLIGWIESNLTNMFTDVNEKVGTIAAEVGQTPSGWNGGVYQMIRGLSENVIVPIAGIIITFVLCYELISMITEKNNLHDMDTWMAFKRSAVRSRLSPPIRIAEVRSPKITTGED